jgi:Response regulator containing CheY-like receiver domain and AraC-type DNA-binding domain
MKIMIVDDEPFILNGIENIIINEYHGCTEIVKASDGIEAVDKLKNFSPDLIITDICMPEMSGLELIQKVLEGRICNRFIILSGYADFEYARQAMQYKALDYILKPIDKVELVQRLNDISKSIEHEEEKLINQELSKIKEMMFYDVPYEEFIIDKNIISMIFPLQFFMVILVQMNDKYEMFDTNIFDNELKQLIKKYYIFPINHKKQIIVLANFDEIICEEELYKELSYMKIKNNGYIKGISMSKISDKIDTINSLYNDALRHLHFSNYSPRRSTYEENDIKKVFSITDYHDIAKLLELSSEEDIVGMLNVYIEKLISISREGNISFNRIYSVVVSDINVYLKKSGLVLDTVFEVNMQLYNEVTNITDDLQLKNEVQKIVFELWDYLRKKSSRNRYSESVLRILDYINKNYMLDISLDDVAVIVNLHPNYASSLFKKEVGTSFINYLNSYRIIKAKTFIKRNSELSLEKIGEMVGYDNPCRFTKVFKKYCNITPGEYRSQINLLMNSY